METNQSIIYYNDYKELLTLVKKTSSKVKPSPIVNTNKSPVQSKATCSKNLEPTRQKSPVSQKQPSKPTPVANKRIVNSTSTLTTFTNTDSKEFSKTAISLMSTMMENQVEHINNAIPKTKQSSEKTWQRIDKIHGKISDVSIYCDTQVNKLCDVSGICQIIRALDKRNLKRIIIEQENQESKKHKKLSIFSLPNHIDIPSDTNFNSKDSSNDTNYNVPECSQNDLTAQSDLTVLHENDKLKKPKKYNKAKQDEPVTYLEMYKYHTSVAPSLQSLPQQINPCATEINVCESQPICTEKSPETLQNEITTLKDELEKYKHYTDVFGRIKTLEVYEHNLRSDIIRSQKILHDLTEERQKIEVEYLSIQDMVQTLESKCGNCKQLLMKKIELEKQFNDLKHQMKKSKRTKLRIKMEDKAIQHNSNKDKCKEKCTIILKGLRRGLTKCDLAGAN